MRKGALAVACTTFIVAIACGESRFTCEDDDACAADGVQGTCEPTGACSFPDDSCPSGRRYGDHGRSDLAGMCVELESTSTSDPSTTITTTTMTTTSVGETASSLDTTMTTAPTTSTASTEGEAGSSSGGPTECPPTWWDCAWTRRVEVTTPATSAVDDVPVLLRLTADRFDFAAAQASGEDLRVVADGVVLPHELETWSDGDAVVWVGLPTIGGERPGALWLYHGNPAATDAQAPDEVWSDDFGAVWHMTGGALDSSGNGNDGVPTPGVLESAGIIGNATEIGEVTHRIDVPPSPSITDVLIGGGTLSAWIFLDGWGGTSRGRIADNTAGADGGWMFYASNDNGGELRVRHGYAAEQVIWRSPSATIVLGQWHHVAATFTAGVDAQPRLFIDGAEVEALLSQGDILGDPVSDAGNDLVIGNSDVPDRWFDGRIDELRVERTVRSPEWIAVQVQSMRDELLSYGAVESWQ